MIPRRIPLGGASLPAVPAGSAVPHRGTCAAAAMRVGRVGKGTTTSGNTNVGSPVIPSFGKPQALPFAFCDCGGCQS